MSDIPRPPIADQSDTGEAEAGFRQLVQSWLTCPLIIVSDGEDCETTSARADEKG